MPGQPSPFRARLRRGMVALTVAGAGFAAAGVATIAAAKTFTLNVGSHAKVMSVGGHTARENIIVNGRGMAVYWLSGNTKQHPECTKSNGCFGFWPPVTVTSAHKLSKAPGIKGRITTWRRNGLLQVLLNGHPLYTFANDKQRNVATGDGIKGFHGTWHVDGVGPATPVSSPGSSSSTTSSTYSYPYPTSTPAPTSSSASTSTSMSTSTSTTTSSYSTTYSY
jgi:predicted lipoprotein with Yx(FWY)xxD motif